MIIGLVGYKQSGKDTTANILVEEFGFERMAFGDALRQMALAIDPILDTKYGGWHTEYEHYSTLLDQLGYEYAKKIPSVREFLQRLGTEAVRNVLGEQTWINVIERRVRASHNHNIVITDVRFPNEAEFIRSASGPLWRIIRNDAVTTDLHPSETMIDSLKPTCIIDNTGTIEELKRIVRIAYELELREPSYR